MKFRTVDLQHFDIMWSFILVDCFSEWSWCVKCSQLDAYYFCCLHIIDGQYQSYMFMNHLFLITDLGVSLKMYLTIFHLKSVFFVFCLQIPQMQVGFSQQAQDLVIGAQKIDPMSCNHIMRHLQISRDKCACDRRDTYICPWFAQ